jgi:polysaccharide biosynthesis transport protein
MDNPQPPPANHEPAPREGREAYVRYVEAAGYVHERHNDLESGGLIENWRTLCRCKVSVILITFLGAVAGVLLTLPQKPIYQARATLEIQNINENFLNMKQVTPVSDGDSSTALTEIQTQIRLLQSESLTKRVLAKLKGRSGTEPKVGIRGSSIGRKTLQVPEPKPEDESDFGRAAAGLKVRASGQTRVIEVSYDSTDPQFAAAFVNTLAGDFIESSLAARLKTSEITSEGLSRQLKNLRIRLEKSEDALQSYARGTGLMLTSEKTNISEEKLRQLQQELSKTQADRIMAQSRWEITKTSPPEALPDVLNDSSLRSLQEKLTELRRQQAELITIYTENHDRVKQTEAQIVPLEAALQKERSAILGRLRNDYETALQREQLLTAEYASQAHLVTDEGEKSIKYSILKREVDSNREIYEAMLQRVKEASIASAVQTSNVRIIDRAEPPARPYKPSLPLNAALGLFSGLCIGAASAIMRGRTDRRLHAPGEARLLLNIPELQVIPTVPKESRRLNNAGEHYTFGTPILSMRRLSGELVTWHSKSSPIAESFRSLLTSILFSGDNGDAPRVLVLTSPGSSEGKTTVASNLAVALAQIKRRVLIIDGDLRKPRMHELFDLPNERGFSCLLDNPQLPDQWLNRFLVQETSIPGLFVLTSGPAIETSTDLLYSANLSEVLARFKIQFDVIIIDTPPMLQMPDARVLGRIADAVILVTRAGYTTREAAEAANHRLTGDKTRILGTVLNDWNPKNGRRYRKYNYYREAR